MIMELVFLMDANDNLCFGFSPSGEVYRVSVGESLFGQMAIGYSLQLLQGMVELIYPAKVGDQFDHLHMRPFLDETGLSPDIFHGYIDYTQKEVLWDTLNNNSFDEPFSSLVGEDRNLNIDYWHSRQ